MSQKKIGFIERNVKILPVVAVAFSFVATPVIGRECCNTKQFHSSNTVPQRDDIEVATFRYLIRRYNQDDRIVFVSEKSHDCSEPVYMKLSQSIPGMHQYSDAISDGMQIVDRRTKMPGVMFTIHSIQWASTNRTKVMATVRWGDQQSYGMECILGKLRSQWNVFTTRVNTKS